MIEKEQLIEFLKAAQKYGEYRDSCYIGLKMSADDILTISFESYDTFDSAEATIDEYLVAISNIDSWIAQKEKEKHDRIKKEKEESLKAQEEVDRQRYAELKKRFGD